MNGWGCCDAGVQEDSSRRPRGELGEEVIDRRLARSSTAAASGGRYGPKGGASRRPRGTNSVDPPHA